MRHCRLSGRLSAISIKAAASNHPAESESSAQPAPSSKAAIITRVCTNEKPYKHMPKAANTTDMPPRKCPLIIKPAQPIKINTTLRP